MFIEDYDKQEKVLLDSHKNAFMSKNIYLNKKNVINFKISNYKNKLTLILEQNNTNL